MTEKLFSSFIYIIMTYLKSQTTVCNGLTAVGNDPFTGEVQSVTRPKTLIK